MRYLRYLRHDFRPRLAAAALLLPLGAALAGCAAGKPDTADRAAMSAATGGAGDWLRFSCESGHPVQARYAADAQSALVRREGREYRMSIARSASGARYAGEGLEWWTKGSGAGASGLLLRHEADGQSGELLDRCTQQ